MNYRTQPYLTTNNILNKLTPEQIAMAKAAGLFFYLFKFIFLRYISG